MLLSTDAKPLYPWIGRLLPVLIVLLSAVHLYCPPTRVAELEVIPDSVEYAVAAHQFATTGHYQIHVNGRAVPPRYPPGFSVLFLSPIYFVAPGNIGNGIFAVWIAGIAVALFVYLIANKLAGPWGGVFAAIFLLHHEQVTAYTQVIMTDVPALSLGLMECYLYLLLQGRENSWSLTGSDNHLDGPALRSNISADLKTDGAGPCRPGRSRKRAAIYLAAGVVAALAISIRPLTGLLLLPFLFDIFHRRHSGMWRDLLVLGIPAAAVVVGTGVYQWHAFGDWRRTGYQFWLPVPYDYVSLTFSPRYLKDNLAIIGWNLVWLPLVFGAFGAVALWTKKTLAFRSLAQFTLLAVIPLSTVHLFYFFTDIRFHFLALTLAMILAGGGIAAMVPQNVRTKFWPVLFLLPFTILLPRIRENPLEEGKPIRYRVATAAAKFLPENAVLISRIDPDYLEEMVARGTSRRILPIDRKTQYASDVIAFHRVAILNPPARNAADRACLGLINGGAEKLYPLTADEEVGEIEKWIRQGVPVYLELLSTEPDEASRVALGRAFKLVPVSGEQPWLVRLELIR